MPTPRSNRRALLALPLLILLLFGAGIAALFLGVGDDEGAAGPVTTSTSAPDVTIEPPGFPGTSTTAIVTTTTVAPTTLPTAVPAAPVPVPAAPGTSPTSPPPTGATTTTTTPSTTTTTGATAPGGTTATTAPRAVIDPGPSQPSPDPVTRDHPATGGTPALWPAAVALALGVVALRQRRQHSRG